MLAKLDFLCNCTTSLTLQQKHRKFGQLFKIEDDDNLFSKCLLLFSSLVETKSLEPFNASPTGKVSVHLFQETDAYTEYHQFTTNQKAAGTQSEHESYNQDTMGQVDKCLLVICTCPLPCYICLSAMTTVSH